MKKLAALIVIGLLLMPNGNVLGLTEGKRAADQLKEFVVTTGEGLYADPFEANRYVYSGATDQFLDQSTMQNFITFNNELWRIIAIEADGTIKIVKATDINTIFDPGYSSDISGVTTSGSVIGTRYSANSNDYCYATSEDIYFGCSIWGSATTTLNSAGTAAVAQINGKNLPSTESYINIYLNGAYYNSLNSDKNYIVTHLFNVGALPDQYSRPGTEMISYAQANTWRGKVGLIGADDLPKSRIFNKPLSEVMEGTGNSWLNKMNEAQGTATMSSTGDGISYYGTVSNSPRGAYPVVYLTDKITLSGTGTYQDPFVIVGLVKDETNQAPENKSEEVNVPGTDSFISVIISCAALALILIGMIGYYFMNKRKKG